MLRSRLKIARSGYAISPGDERTGRDLVGQRLEQMKVLPVDQRHLDWSSVKLLTA